MTTPLERLLRPRSIAIVGASPEPSTIGNNVLVNIERAGFEGPLHLVSRNRDAIGARTCVRTIDDLPEGVDAVVLIVPAAGVREAIAACVRRKVGGALVFAAGFGEAGDAGIREQAEVAAVARAGGLAMIGPNCIGFVNFVDAVPLTFEPVLITRVEGPGVCAVAQSGGMAGNLRMALTAKHVPVAFSISTGNEAVISTTDIIGALIDSPDVSLFALLVEQIGDPGRLIEVAGRARQLGKPIVLMHSGRSARSREAAKSHTGALAGDYAVMKAFAEHAGVVVVDTPDELFDVAAVLARYPRPDGKGAAITTNSGAIRGFALDIGEDIGLSFAAIDDATKAVLRAALPDFATIDNPLDLTAQTMSNPSLFGDSAAALLADPNVGMAMVAAMGGGPVQQRAKWDAVRPILVASAKPTALVLMGDGAPLIPDMLAEIAASRVPFFRSPERALRAFRHVAAFGRARTASLGARAPIAEGVTIDVAQSGPLAEHRGKALLANIGISVPLGRLARSLADAKAAATAVGYPVALKAQAASLAHKSDAGGVALGIADADALAAAYSAMLAAVERAAPGHTLDGVLIEAMAPRGGLEMIVGARRDPHWGPVLVVGLGGVFTEILADVRLIPATASDAEIERQIMTLKAARLLTGYRGQPARDVRALAGTLARLGAIMLASPRLTDIEINPLMVYADGNGVLALDALLVMEG